MYNQHFTGAALNVLDDASFIDGAGEFHLIW